MKRKKENRKKFTAENFPANENKISSHSWITFRWPPGNSFEGTLRLGTFFAPHSFVFKALTEKNVDKVEFLMI